MTPEVPATELPPRLKSIVAACAQEAARNADRFGWDPMTGRSAAPGSLGRRDGPPLKVLMCKGGKSLFYSLQDKRLQVMWPNEPIAKAPDIVVTTDPLRLVDDPRSLELPGDVWQRLESGAAKLMIDSSSEGYPFEPDLFAGIHRALAGVGLGERGYIYVTQDRGFASDYVSHHQSEGGGEPGIEVLVHDRFVQHMLAQTRSRGREDFEQGLRRYAAAADSRLRRFVCLNNKYRPARLLFLLRLLRDGLFDQGYISLGRMDEFAGHELTRATLIKRTLTLPGMRRWAEDLSPLIDDLAARSPHFIGWRRGDADQGAEKIMVLPQWSEEYQESWFSVVTETDFSNRLHRITEKPFKPLLGFHPFIVLGSCGSLRLIREYGFKTFPDLFDEHYDEEDDPNARFEMVCEQVARHCAIDERELARRCEATTEAVVFNALWGFIELPRLFAERIDAALVDRLIEIVHGP